MNQAQPKPTNSAPTTFVGKAMAARTSNNAPQVVPLRAQSNSKAAKSQKPAKTNNTPVLIVAGIDANGRCHASAFGAELRDAAMAAGEGSHMSVISIDTDALREIASKLPTGKIYDSGKAFVPFVKGEVFDALANLVPIKAQKDRGASLPHNMTADHKNIVSKAEVVSDWDKMKVGSMVLAHSDVNEDDAWYEAVIVEAQTANNFLVRWWAYDDEKPFTRRKGQLALLPAELPKRY